MVTLAEIKTKQNEHRELLKEFYAKHAQVQALKAQYQVAESEFFELTGRTRDAIRELRQLGQAFALQIENDFTPKIPGTEQGEINLMPISSELWDSVDPLYISDYADATNPVAHQEEYPPYDGTNAAGTEPF